MHGLNVVESRIDCVPLTINSCVCQHDSNEYETMMVQRAQAADCVPFVTTNNKSISRQTHYLLLIHTSHLLLIHPLQVEHCYHLSSNSDPKCVYTNVRLFTNVNSLCTPKLLTVHKLDKSITSQFAQAIQCTWLTSFSN